MRKLLSIRIFRAIFCAALSLLSTPLAIAQSTARPVEQLILENAGFTFAVSSISPFNAVLTLPSAREFKTFTLVNPDRLVVDVRGAVMAGSQDTLNVGGDTVSKIRFGQFSRDPDVMRVVLDMKKTAKIGVNGSENQIIFGQPARPSAKAVLPAPKISKLNDRVVVTVPINMPKGTIVEEIGGPFRVVVNIPDYAPVEALKSYPVNEGLVDAVRVSYYNDNPVTTRIIVDCKLRAEYKIDEKDGSFSISVIQPSVYKKTIAVDPGHGGKDDGTRSGDGELEKDLNLSVAFKLAALLEAAGAKVVMTRKSDVFIPLADRAAIANRAWADAFVSVHANALDNHWKSLNKRGTQTYYYHEQSKPLAAIMHRWMTASLGAGDLGMFKARYKVLRETSMKAVLCELGYMTHPSDSALLKLDDFRENGARGMFNGLNEFFGGRGAMLPPVELPEYAIALLPGPSPAQVYAEERGAYDLPADLEIDAEEFAVESRQQPERLNHEAAAAPASSGSAVKKGAPSRLSQEK